ncbi:TPA: hypothetical protein MMJ71_004780 [Salmonella enterica subsp. enterica serovar Typhimurium]|nr:hypothetical protein [Salmonella enterica subsp. enterica serovar Typhimurium]
MAKNRKRAKRKMKRNLYKRYKQTAKVQVLEKTWLNPAIVNSNESPKEIKAHLLYEGKYETENKEYQSQLNAVYGNGAITPVERFISNQAIIIHSCSKCSIEFFGSPKFLLKGVHNCSVGGMGSSLNYTKKQNNKVHKKINGEELVKDLDQMILSGVKPHLITQKTGVSIQIVKWYKERYHA